MANDIARLVRERDEAIRDYSDNGKAASLLWAKSAPYIDLMYAVSSKYYDFGEVSHFDAAEEIWSDTLEDLYRQDPILGGRDSDGNYNPLSEAWIRGWYEGISDFYNEVRDRI